MVDVAVTQNDDMSRAINQALDLLTVETLIRNRLIAVKPNDTWASAIPP